MTAQGMAISSKTETALLFIGDILIFFISVYLALFLRHFEVPDQALFMAHFLPFSILALLWTLVFFIAGLYENHTLLLRNKLPNLIFNAQVANTFLAIVFFYFLPQFGINPKTNLFIYIITASTLVFFWRLYSIKLFARGLREKAIIIGSGEEVREILEEVNNNERYAFRFISSINLDHTDEVNFKEEIVAQIYEQGVSVIVVDFDNKKIEPILQHLYNLMFGNIRFIDMHKVYEDIFDRVPLALLKHSWFLENISLSPKITYDIVKRCMDIFLGLILGVITILITPFVVLAIKLGDGGSIFFKQERVGKNNQPIYILKFRTMSERANIDVVNDDVARVTKVGAFLRTTRIDELPQIWNVITGDISLIGPRPELPELTHRYEHEIPYYAIRHLITPGLSGWAQLYHEAHPHHGAAVEETKEKLSYDLYYVKNRSAMLDLKIALKTIRTLLSRTGA